MSDFGTLITDLGGAASSLFGAEGNSAQAQSFQGAADLATQNAQLAATSTRIQETQTARSVAMSLGTTQADVAGAGFTMSGSALDLLKSSAQQGSLAKSLVNIQGAINENSYAAQAGAYSGEAAAAKEASKAGMIGAIASVGGALISGTGSLASAGKTVVQGINYLFGPSAATTDAAIGSAFDSADAVDAASMFSTTDQALSAGADLGSTVAESGIGLDTSGLGIGSALSDVSSAVGAAFDSVSSAVGAGVDALFGEGAGAALGAAFGSIIPGLGLISLVDMIPGVSDIPVVGPVLDAVSGAIGAVGNAVGSVIGGVADAVGSVIGGVADAVGSAFGSVICTALYKRGKLTRSVWYGAQKYGRDVAPEHVYLAYLMWGQPIANAIAKSETFAKIVAPIFVPWAHELAVLAGEKTAKSTLAGRVIFKVTYAFSAALGKLILYRRDLYVKA
jgi:hypothetical protein